MHPSPCRSSPHLFFSFSFSLLFFFSSTLLSRSILTLFFISPHHLQVIKPKAQAVAEDAQPAKSRYIPPEQSPSGQKGRVNIEWERRVQFEAMKNGNGVKQNDILMDSLKREG